MHLRFLLVLDKGDGRRKLIRGFHDAAANTRLNFRVREFGRIRKARAASKSMRRAESLDRKIHGENTEKTVLF